MLKPLNDHIIVNPATKEEKTSFGILLPESVNKEKPEKGEVISVGPGKMLENGTRATMSVKPGDKVIFTKYAPNEIKIDNTEYLVLSESDILAVIE